MKITASDAFALYQSAEAVWQAKRERLVAEHNELENALEMKQGTRWLIEERLNRIEAEIDDIDDFIERSQQELALNGTPA